MALRVGVAGLRRGSVHVDTMGAHPDCELVAVCDVRPGVARRIAEEKGVPLDFEDYSELCAADLDAIVLATPGPVHVANTIEALEHDKHVLCEVPAAWRLEECWTLARAVEQSKCKYMLAENMNYVAYIQSYNAIVNAGTIGKPIYAEAEYVDDLRRIFHDWPDGLPGDSEKSVTWRAAMPPIYYCTHSLGPVLEILKTRCVTACGLHTGSNIGEGWGAIDMEVGIFTTASGAVVKIMNAFSVARRPGGHFFVIYGTEGYLESPRPGCDGPHRLYSEQTPNLRGPIEMPLQMAHPTRSPEMAASGRDSYEYLTADAFVRCILNDTDPPIDVYRGLDYSAPGLCAHLSAEAGGEPVRVPDFRPSCSDAR